MSRGSATALEGGSFRKEKGVIPVTRLGVLIAAAFLIAGCGSTGGTPAPQGSAAAGELPSVCQGQTGSGNNEIHIYSSLPMQGTNERPSTALVEAMKDLLDGAKVGDYTVKFFPLDDSSTANSGNWDGAVEQANANKAAADPDAMVYIGTANSGASKLSIPITNQACLVQIAPDNSYPGLTKAAEGVTEPGEPDIFYPKGYRNYVRVSPTDDRQGSAASQWAKDLGITKAYVLDDLQVYGAGLANAFASGATTLGITVVTADGKSEGYDPKATDYVALAQKIKASGADLVYVGAITGSNTGKLWKDLRDVLGDIKIMSGNGIFEEAFATGAGAAAKGTYMTFNILSPDQLTGNGEQFVKDFTAKHGAPEATTIFGAVAAQIALDAIGRAGTKDRGKILQAVWATKDFDSYLGPIGFDANGDTTLYSVTAYQLGDAWPPTFLKAISSK